MNPRELNEPVRELDRASGRRPFLRELVLPAGRGD